MKLALAALTILAASAVSAKAESGADCPLPPASPSIVYLGDVCEFTQEEEVTVIEAAITDHNAALVDQYGMPTSMPVIMRPGVDTAKVTPAASETAAASPSGETPPASTEAKPEAPAETPKEGELPPQQTGDSAKTQN